MKRTDALVAISNLIHTTRANLAAAKRALRSVKTLAQLRDTEIIHEIAAEELSALLWDYFKASEEAQGREVPVLVIQKAQP